MTTTPVLYRARWGILAAYSLVALVLQLQWLSFAPIARQASLALGVDTFGIDLLSLVFMLVFVVTCVPASYVIERFGVRVGVGIGAAMMGVFGLVKAADPSSYLLVLISQIGVALAQPLVLNAVTKLAAQWFPIAERATAVGIATLAQFLGIIAVMLVTPALVDEAGGRVDLSGMLLIYGIISAAACVLLLVVLRERPPTPPGDVAGETRLTGMAGVRHMLRQPDARRVIVLFVIGLGIFNALSTCIDQLCALSGLDVDDTGLVGGLMFITGIAGAAIVPPISDRRRQRKPFLVLAMVGMVPAIALLALANGFLLLAIGSALLGLFLLGAGAPIGFQYAAEVSYPTAEPLSQGAILLVGQLSGIALIVAINLVGIGPIMWVFVALAALAALVALRMGESKVSG